MVSEVDRRNRCGAVSQPNAVATLLQSLVRIPSVNPDGDPGTDKTGELECAEFLGGFLTGLGADVRFDEVFPDRPNVIAEFPGGEGKPRVLFAPHTDTVGVGNMTIDPFGGEIRDGRLWGRGACDTKGTMAAMLSAFRELGTEGIAALDVGVSFVGLMGEETGQPGSRDFAKRYAGQYAFAMVGEPTQCQIVHRHKGTLWTTLTTRGKSCHGSQPERGDNAIAKMAPIVDALHGEFRERLTAPEFGDDLLGPPTLNVGQIQGGIRSNIVPACCELLLDMRVTPALAKHGALNFLEDFLAERNFEVEVRSTLECAALDTDPANPFVQRLQKLSCKPQLVGAPWFCDAATLADGDIPAVAAGPGSIDQAHTEDEWIDLEALTDGVRFYREFLTSGGF